MNYLEIAGTVIGLVYLWLEYKASIYLWIAGIIMPAIYIFVYYDAGLYADMGINVYYLGAAVYGFAVWMLGRKAHEGREMPITRMPRRLWPAAGMVCCVLFAGIGLLLISVTDSDVPWMDSFTTALSVVGMWMLARKHLEQWLVWIVVDVASAGLYVYKELYFTAVLYALYAVIAIFGYINWKKMMNNATPHNPACH